MSSKRSNSINCGNIVWNAISAACRQSGKFVEVIASTLAFFRNISAYIVRLIALYYVSLFSLLVSLSYTPIRVLVVYPQRCKI